jgi:hypothetical protein
LSYLSLSITLVFICLFISRMCTNRTSPECPKHPVQPLHHTLVIC